AHPVLEKYPLLVKEHRLLLRVLDEPSFHVEERRRVAVVPQTDQDPPGPADARNVLGNALSRPLIVLSGSLGIIERALVSPRDLIVEAPHASRLRPLRELGLALGNQLPRVRGPSQILRCLVGRSYRPRCLIEEMGRLGVG